MVKIVFSLLCILCLKVSAANEFFGPTEEIDGQKISKMGQGYRKAYWFRAKVYEAAFYAKDLKPQSPKRLKMHFFYDIKKEESIEAWQKSFTENCEKPCKVETKAFLDSVIEIKEDHKHVYTFFSDRVIVNRQGKEVTFTNPGLSKLLFDSWFGKSPPTEELKKALLGENN